LPPRTGCCGRSMTTTAIPSRFVARFARTIRRLSATPEAPRQSHSRQRRG
jgi:hypothetical protein